MARAAIASREPDHPTQSEIAQCHGKTRFPSAQLAWRVIQRDRRRHIVRDFYRCPVCGGWHIGTSNIFRRGTR